MAATNLLAAIESTECPQDEAALADLVRSSADDQVALYPIGGGTSLDFGLPGARAGIGVELAQLDQVVDYPAADMTITVQAGMRMDELDRVLAEHGQRLPLDVPAAGQATLGGVLATDFSGPRRLGYGTARDYLIGIRAIDGRGQAFAGGGRVVKNVAGYDFCKLLVGSLGTLGIITEVTLKVVPRSPSTAAVVMAVGSTAELNRLLAHIVDSDTQPVAAEWLVGPAWHGFASELGWPNATEHGWVVLWYEGTTPETDWSIRQVKRETQSQDGPEVLEIATDRLSGVMESLCEFPANEASPVVLRASVLPSRLPCFVEQVQQHVDDASIQAHAGNGVARVRLDAVPKQGIAHMLTNYWQPTAATGHLVMLRNRSSEMTTRAVWGAPTCPLELMRRIKQQFDPQQILNPGRFVY